MRIMDTILKPEEVTEVDGRQYLNPQVGLDESNRFIDNLRSTQAQQNQKIATDTFNLGTNIASSQGGLGTNTPANMGYFTSRLQTPQTNSAVANLRSAAQAQALNQALQNEQEIWKKKYQDAYRNYQKRMYDKANTPTTPQNPETKGGVDETTTGYYGNGWLSLDENDTSAGGQYIRDPGTNNIIWVTPEGDNVTLYRQQDGSYSQTRPGSNKGGRGVALNLGGLLSNGISGIMNGGLFGR